MIIDVKGWQNTLRVLYSIIAASFNNLASSGLMRTGIVVQSKAVEQACLNYRRHPFQHVNIS